MAMQHENMYRDIALGAALEAEGAPALDGYDIVRLARVHNDANVLSLAARFLDTLLISGPHA